jgi:hypothetical protein
VVVRSIAFEKESTITDTASDVQDSHSDTASLSKKDNIIGKVIRKATGMKEEK